MRFNYTSLAPRRFEMPDDWRVVSIDDVAVLNELSIQPDYPHKRIEYIDIASVEKGTAKSVQELPLEDAPSRARRIVQDNDTLIATVRPNLEHYVYVKNVKQNTVASTGFAVVTAKDVNPRFLYYYLTTKPFTAYLSQVADSHTSAYPAINPDVIETAELLLPPASEQRAIAAILGALDDKIELNRQMNQTLEAMGQALFKSWFVDFEPFRDQGMEESPLGPIPRGWRVGELNNIANFVKGVSYRSDALQESTVALVTLKSVARGGGYQQEGLKPYIGEYKPEQQLQPGEVIVAHTDLTQAAEVLGRAARVQAHPQFPTLVASLDLVIVRPVGQAASNEFLYTLLSQSEFQEHAYSYANGTTVLHLSAKALPEYQCLLPPPTIIEAFTTLVRPIYERIDHNEAQSYTLAAIRDTLLPKLLSGEIRVKDAEKFVERAT
jgi:Restriction endonuclease S subunits